MRGVSLGGRSRFDFRQSFWNCGLLCCLLFAAQTVFAQDPDSESPQPKTKASAKAAKSPRSKPAKGSKKKIAKELAPGVRNYASDNFIVHTDLSEEEAQDLMERLETMLKLISTYWDRPNARVIEMYVVKDLSIWPKDVIPPAGLHSIQTGGGLTITRTREQIDSTGQRTVIAAEAVVYAVADRGTPQHEAVHAYCGQTFGRTGPTWYSEGMAEMGQYWKDKDGSVNCHAEVVTYLKSESPKDLDEITDLNQQTGDSWQNYAWRWALCHLLANNPNYAPRFRPLGLALLTNQKASFEDVYGEMAPEISFEYVFFLQHFDRGYRADLCGWDWKTKFTQLRGTATVQAKIDAGHGWQASRLTAKEGTKYACTVAGAWKLQPDGDELSPNGAADGQGKLVGILFDDYKLSEPFDLGDATEWTAPQDGKLFLRCQDAWTELGDNKGSVTVKWKLAE